MRRIYGILIIAGAAFLWLMATGYVVSVYDAPPMMEESRLAEMDPQTAELTRRQVASAESTMRITSWISFTVASVIALVMVVMGGRMLLFG